MQLKNVVFPAPFGPMSAVILLRSRWILTSLTAVMPPKRMVTCSAFSMDAGLLSLIGTAAELVEQLPDTAVQDAVGNAEDEAEDFDADDGADVDDDSDAQ